jgi:glycosyl transferase family 2
MTWPLIAASTLCVIVWLVLTALYVLASRQVRPLEEVLAGRSAAGAGAPLPGLSIVVTARDEAQDIEATVRHALAQVYPGLEVIVVDDRSADGTSAILDGLAPSVGGDRLRVIHVRDLPAGWIGKCHACHVGAGEARGAFLLFMDGDVTLAAPDLLGRIVTWMERSAVDHLALFPDLRPYGALQAGLMHAFEQAMLLVVRAWEMDRDRPRGGGGVGAFNLIRRTAYDRIGGHLRLRMEVADDYKLGMLLKESGARQRIYSGMGLVRCPWHRGTLAVLRGLEKNMFSGVDYSLTRLVAETAALVALNVGPVAIGLVAGTPVGWAPFAVQAACVFAAAASAARRIDRHPLVLGALYPLSLALLSFAMWNSVLRTLARGGVLWRGSFYPLAALRRGLVRPGDGRRAVPSGPTGRGA